VRLREWEWTYPFLLELSSKGGNRVQDFFGLGMGPPSPTSFLATLWDTELLLAYCFSKGRLGVGVVNALFSSASLPAEWSALSYQALTLKLYWDTRDKLLLPRHGVRAAAEYEWIPTSHPFSRWYFLMEGFQPLTVSQGLSAAVAGAGREGNLPYNLLADLGLLAVPGVREFRYRGNFAVASWLQYRYRVAPGLLLGAFATTGAVAPKVEQLWAALRFGAGVSVEFSFERVPRLLPRWEFGIFNGQWTFQGGFRADF
jgi:hypothetical protein